jgi:hypothetical protein
MASPAKVLSLGDLLTIFGLEPVKAIAYLKQKGEAIT